MLRASCVWWVLIGGAVLGAAIGIALGAPSDWPKSSPRALVLTAACIGAAYLLLVAWEKQLPDAQTVAAMKRLVELTVPTVLLGGVWASAGMEISAGGNWNKFGTLVAMLAVTLLAVVLLRLAALHTIEHRPPLQTSGAQNGLGDDGPGGDRSGDSGDGGTGH